MNWIQRLFNGKNVDKLKNSTLIKQYVIVSVCPNCNVKGYRTTLTNNSYACKKCGIWWTN